MAIRDDVTVEYTTNPRVAEIASPATEIVMQDIVSTLRVHEESFQGLSYKKLVNASGKEDLGGGVSVGITVALQNLKLAFEGRTIAAEIGTVTDSPTAPVSGTQILQDTSADFSAANVARGSLVINFTDQSVADVISADSATQLTTKTLVNGISNTYTIGDDYQVFNIVQCSATGGNLVALDEDQFTIPSILPTAFTQVILTSSASATLSNQSSIEYSSFGGGVTIDVINGYSGTSYPIGTIESPSNNVIDAITIATSRGLSNIYINGNITFTTSHNISNFTISGQTPIRTTIIIEDEAECSNVIFQKATVTGILDGNSRFEDCVVGELTYVSGTMHNCGLYGTIYLDGNANALISNCSVIDPNNTPIIDMGAEGQSCILSDWSGEVTFTNLTSVSDKISVQIDGGNIKLDSTINGGIIGLNGIGTLENNATSYTSLNTAGLMSSYAVAATTWDEVYINTTNGISGTSFPIGTIRNPVNNITDAKTIADRENVNSFNVSGNLTLNATFDNYTFRSDSSTSVINLNNQSVEDTTFTHMGITGICNGSIHCHECDISTVTNLKGAFVDSAFMDITPITMASGFSVFNKCLSAVAGGNSPIFDLSAGAIDLSVRGYSGGIRFTNSTNAGTKVTVEFIAGKFNFDDTNTAGEFHIRGVCDMTGYDKTATANVYLDGAINADLVWDENASEHHLDGSTGEILHQTLHIDKAIYVDPEATSNGTGTAGHPYDNIGDAIDAAEAHGFKKIVVYSEIELDRNLKNFNIIGVGTPIIACGGYDLTGSEFTHCKMRGDYVGSIIVQNSVLDTGFELNGFFENCGISGNLTSQVGSSALLKDCVSIIQTVTIDCNSGGASHINLTDFAGNLILMNCNSAGDVVYAGVREGTVTIDSSCTAGFIAVGGKATVTNNTGGTTVNLSGLLQNVVSDSVWNAQLSEYQDAGTAGKNLNDTSYTEKWIYVDTELGSNGDGKESAPFNNITDAIDFAESVGWYKLRFLSDAVLDRKLKNFTIEGVGLPEIDFNGKDVNKSEFHMVKLKGTQVGAIRASLCWLTDTLDGLNGIYMDCGLTGTVTIADDSVTSLVNMYSIFNSTSVNNIIDMGASNTNVLLNIRKYSGSLQIKNVNTANKKITAEFNGGACVIDDTNTAGTIAIANLPDTAITDNSNGSTMIFDSVYPGSLTISDDVWDEQISEHLDTGTTGNKLNTASSGGVDYDALADAIWDDNIVNRVTPNSAGLALYKLLTEALNDANVHDNLDGTKTVTIYTEAGTPNILRQYTITLDGANEDREAI